MMECRKPEQVTPTQKEFFFFKGIFKIEAWLIYYVVLVSAI